MVVSLWNHKNCGYCIGRGFFHQEKSLIFVKIEHIHLGGVMAHSKLKLIRRLEQTETRVLGVDSHLKGYLFVFEYNDCVVGHIKIC